MAIRTQTLEQLKKLKEFVGGNQVTFSQINDFAQEYDIPALTLAAVVRRNAVCVSRGVFDLSAIFGETTPQVTTEVTPQVTTEVKPQLPKQTTIAKAVAKAVSDISFVPERSDLFVPHGDYVLLKAAIKSRSFLPIYIVGESGNGKTFSVEQACAETGRELIIINITNETTEEDLIGSFSLRDGNLVWVDGAVLTAARRGAVLLLDEVDQASPRILAIQHILNGAKEYYVKRTGEVVKIAEGFNVIATANTKGDGENADRYYGAGIVNEAFLERFSAVIEQDYPPEVLEVRILNKHIKDKDLCSRLVRFANATRVAYVERAIANQITTRRLVHIAKNLGVFDDVTIALRLAVSRFDASTRDALIELWDASTKSSDDVVPDLQQA